MELLQQRGSAMGMNMRQASPQHLSADTGVIVTTGQILAGRLSGTTGTLTSSARAACSPGQGDLEGTAPRS